MWLQTLLDNGLPDDTQVVIAGLSNTYADYIVTYEEYQVHSSLLYVEIIKAKISNSIKRYYFLGNL